ncbi:FAD/NAD(P)-binding domain-containing protein [Cylindrobasidium torrendii FP15055 ss-10]|uniref:FAD/NAD(P)-binding domain-containing protein n=1 Tax=Cylindrobasidium torrendii FP15055 ss-10 TaxID=1314674 RepID=A0A0D7B3Z8_9AGAR|nr:FAD/NAD(P)-binding domain-containing protein [Cylindrobasidium torrendii FP15055 ss-10]
MDSDTNFKQLRVAVIGGGLGGLSAAIALRRSGHLVEIYERRNFNVEVGAAVSCAANGTQWLREWEVDIPSMKPVVLMKLVMHDWETGEILNQYDLENYEEQWGNVYNMFHRQDMHAGLLRAATSPDGLGTPATVVVDHVCESVDYEKGTVTFQNGRTTIADLIIGSDGIRSVVRREIGIIPSVKSAPQTCYRCNVRRTDVERLGLQPYSLEPAIHYWGGMPQNESSTTRSQFYKVVMSPCSDYDIVSFYCFMPTEMTNHTKEGFSFIEVPVSDITKGCYDSLDDDCLALIKNSIDRMPWRLYKHEPYPHWQKGKVCILGDAAHPMMPHQSQGACQAIEDAAALGIIFSSTYDFTNNIAQGLALYERIRKPRGTRVQEASWRATLNINERIGFTSLTAHDTALAALSGKLTINEMNAYRMHDHIHEEVSKLACL